jgi:hypothetical protein
MLGNLSQSKDTCAMFVVTGLFAISELMVSLFITFVHTHTSPHQRYGQISVLELGPQGPHCGTFLLSIAHLPLKEDSDDPRTLRTNIIDMDSNAPFFSTYCVSGTR